MNVNLNQFHRDDSGGTHSLTMALDHSAAVLAEHADTRPVGKPVLIPADQEQYPGSYEAWYPVRGGWVYVSPDGVIVRKEDLDAALASAWDGE